MSMIDMWVLRKASRGGSTLSRIGTMMEVQAVEKRPENRLAVDLGSGEIGVQCVIVVPMKYAADLPIGSKVRLVIETGEDATR